MRVAARVERYTEIWSGLDRISRLAARRPMKFR